MIKWKQNYTASIMKFYLKWSISSINQISAIFISFFSSFTNWW